MHEQEALASHLGFFRAWIASLRVRLKESLQKNDELRVLPDVFREEVREQLRVDKGAAARRAASLEAKGYLIRQANPKDGRSQLLFATEKAEGLRNSKAQVETTFYEWLLAELPEAEKVAFCKTLDTIYRRSKQESRAGFPHITALTEQGEGERHE